MWCILKIMDCVCLIFACDPLVIFHLFCFTFKISLVLCNPSLYVVLGIDY